MMNKEQHDNYSPAREAWKRFKRNRPALASLCFIVLSTIVAILGYLITPDSTSNCNNQILQVALKPPGFGMLFLEIPAEIGQEQRNSIGQLFFGKPQEYNYIPVYNHHISGDSIVIEEYTGGIPNKGSISTYSVKNKLVAKRYLLGTDEEGRDELSRLLIATRISLAVGLIAVLISLSIGVTLGALGGYFGGWCDTIVMWLINVTWSLPTLLLVIAITLALGKGFAVVFVAVGFTTWVEAARIVRGQVMSIKQETYIEAARAMGLSNRRIILKHILPNTLGVIVIVAADNFASAILIEAGLSFLGIGVQPPVASWGSMINEGRKFLISDFAYLAFLPGICIMLMVLSFFLLGSGLRDAMDVKNSGRMSGV